MTWLEFWKNARESLATIPVVGDLGPYGQLTLAVWALLWAVRRYRPTWWAWLLRTPLDPEGAFSHFLQAVPGAVIGALWAGGTTLDVEQAAYGLLSGLGSALLHHAIKASPLPYSGKLTPRVMLLGLLCVFTGCADREACYARNDVAFQDVVDDCDDAGFTYDGCPWIPEAKRIQAQRDRRCP